MKRILVTGAAGFVGQHVLAALTAEPSLHGHVMGTGRTRPASLPEGVRFSALDLSDESALNVLIAEFEPTDVLHLAALSSVQQSAETPEVMWRSNLVATMNLAGALNAQAAESRLFFASSGEVYGRAFLSGEAVSEDVTPQPQGSYARSKWIAEQVLTDMLARSKVQVTTLRPFNHIGVGQDERFVIPSFAGQIARIERGLTPPVLRVGNLDAARDFLPVSDVVTAYKTLLMEDRGSARDRIFNISSGHPRKIADVLADLRCHTNAKFDVVCSPDRQRPSEIRVAAGDSSRLVAATGWHPTADWHETLSGIMNDARMRLAPSEL